jgi:hypothetical protein
VFYAIGGVLLLTDVQMASVYSILLCEPDGMYYVEFTK